VGEDKGEGVIIFTLPFTPPIKGGGVE